MTKLPVPTRVFVRAPGPLQPDDLRALTRMSLQLFEAFPPPRVETLVTYADERTLSVATPEMVDRLLAWLGMNYPTLQVMVESRRP